MINLLRDIDSPGFPNDYLITRIKGRRAALIANWNAARAQGLSPGTSDERIWEALLNELEWLYGQMNRSAAGMLCVRVRAAGTEDHRAVPAEQGGGSRSRD